MYHTNIQTHTHTLKGCKRGHCFTCTEVWSGMGYVYKGDRVV